MSDDDRYERGRARFLEVHDEKALAAVEGLGDLGHMIVEVVYGDVYTRSELSTRDRELATVAALVSLGRSAQPFDGGQRLLVVDLQEPRAAAFVSFVVAHGWTLPSRVGPVLR